MINISGIRVDLNSHLKILLQQIKITCLLTCRTNRSDFNKHFSYSIAEKVPCLKWGNKNCPRKPRNLSAASLVEMLVSHSSPFTGESGFVIWLSCSNIRIFSARPNQHFCLSFSLLNTTKHFHLASFSNMERSLLEICLGDNNSFASGKRCLFSFKNKAVNVSKFSGTGTWTIARINRTRNLYFWVLWL